MVMDPDTRCYGWKTKAIFWAASTSTAADLGHGTDKEAALRTWRPWRGGRAVPAPSQPGRAVPRAPHGAGPVRGRTLPSGGRGGDGSAATLPADGAATRGWHTGTAQQRCALSGAGAHSWPRMPGGVCWRVTREHTFQGPRWESLLGAFLRQKRAKTASDRVGCRCWIAEWFELKGILKMIPFQSPTIGRNTYQ